MNKKKNNKKIFFLLLIIIIILIAISLIYFFTQKTSKVFNIGNNKSSQEIVDYFLNIDSYEAEVTIDVKSNKNSNKYVIIQKFASPNISSQEIKEPSNIVGVKIINDGENLKLENSNLNLNNFYENYSYLGNNCLDLHAFIEDYKTQIDSNYEESENELILYTKNGVNNKYTKYKV